MTSTEALLTRIDIESALQSPAHQRPIFHSEADFQHALAWALGKQYQDAQLRLEAPLYGLPGRAAVDIFVRRGEGVCALELKYLKAKLECSHGSERYKLPPTIARDIARYDVCKDILRLEHAIECGQAHRGYAIVLSNDFRFWQDTGFDGIDSAFKIHEGRKVSGELCWSERAGPGTTKYREKPLRLAGEYEMRWLPFSDLKLRNGELRVLVLSITGEMAQ